MTYQQLKDDILNSESAHTYLKDAVIAFDKRDPVKALKNAITLVELMKLRLTK